MYKGPNQTSYRVGYILKYRNPLTITKYNGHLMMRQIPNAGVRSTLRGVTLVANLGSYSSQGVMSHLPEITALRSCLLKYIHGLPTFLPFIFRRTFSIYTNSCFVLIGRSGGALFHMTRSAHYWRALSACQHSRLCNFSTRGIGALFSDWLFV